MDRILYTAAGGAARMLEQQAITSHNLANVNTSGFRQQLDAQRAVPFVADPDAARQGFADIGLPTRVATVASTPGSHFAAGPLEQTGNPLHVALQGQGWFAVRAADGREAYTRAGDFGINADNQLVTSSGQVVLSSNGEAFEIPEQGRVEFSSDGQLSVLGGGDPPTTIQTLGQLKLVNPEPAQLQRDDDGLFRLGNGKPAQADASVRVVSGFVEKSNVSAAQAMTAMIDNARQFELQMKVIRDASSNAQLANGILSAGN